MGLKIKPCKGTPSISDNLWYHQLFFILWLIRSCYKERSILDTRGIHLRSVRIKYFRMLCTTQWGN